jgi:hypothetical protein
MTIYELTDTERAVMRMLIEKNMVVTIGAHADVKRQLTAEREARMQLESVLGRIMDPKVIDEAARNMLRAAVAGIGVGPVPKPHSF